MDRKQLLAEVLRAHRNAGAKSNRLAGKGIDATTVDPRRDIDKVRKYNTRQLQAYQRRLSQFNSRENQYVAGYKGRAIPKKDWEEYQRFEKAHNLKVRAQQAKYNDVIVPGSAGLTAKQYREQMTPTRTFSANQASDGFKEINRLPSQVLDIKTLKRSMRKKMRGPDFVRKQIREQRKQFQDMLDIIGDAELSKKVSQLTDTAFDFLWNNTRFAHNISLQYEISKQMLKGKDEPYYDDVMNNARQDIEEYVSETQKAFNRRRRL